MTRFVIKLCLSLTFGVLLASCSSESEKERDPTSGADDAAPAPSVPDGFTVVEPRYLGLKTKDPELDEEDRVFIAAQCAAEKEGAFFSFRDPYGDDTLHFCLGSFARPERENSEKICIDCQGKIVLTNLYVGIVTDKGASGVADMSVILVAETADFVRTDCLYTYFSDDSLTAGYGNFSVAKNVLEQLMALESGHGVCSRVKLEDYRDLHRVTMGYQENHKAEFSLSRFDLADR